MTALRLSPYQILLAFLCGFAAVLTFHQGSIFLLNMSGIIPNGPFQTRPIPPFGVPAFVNQAFWGGVWGIVFGFLRPYLPRTVNPLMTGFVFGVVGPTFYGWFVLAPLRGAPVAAGFVLENMARGVFINGMYGVGVALFFILADRFAPRTA